MNFLDLFKIMEKNYGKDSSLSDYEFFMYLIDNCITENYDNPFLEIEQDTVKRYIRNQKPFNKKRLKQVIKLKDTKRLITFIKKNYSDARHYDMTCDIQKINPSFNSEQSSFEVLCSDLFWNLIEDLAKEKKPRKPKQKSDSSIHNNQSKVKSNLSTINENNLNRNYYNLFVNNKPFLKESNFKINDTISFCFDTERFLNIYSEASIKEEFKSLSDNVIEQIKQFPSIFANETDFFGIIDESQMFAFGLVEDIKQGKSYIKVNFKIKAFFPQKWLNENTGFDLDKSRTIKEINNTHWNIKRIDLISVLTKLETNPET